jgi:gamma-glutamyl phosphate reductase
VDAVAEVAPAVGRDLIGLVTSRGEIDQLLKLHEVIDLVIPRGSNQLVRMLHPATPLCAVSSHAMLCTVLAVFLSALAPHYLAPRSHLPLPTLPANACPCLALQVSYIQEHTKIPVLGHADGICHIYVDAAADMDKAARICVDAKVDYPAACNAGKGAGR